MGDLDKGVEYYEQSLALHRQLGDGRSIGITLNNLGELAQLQGDLEKAEDLYKQSMAVVREIDDKWLAVHVLLAVGTLSTVQNHQERAVSILAAADALRREIGFESQAHTLADFERAVQRAREALTTERFEAAWQRGGAMSFEEAVEFAMSADGSGLGARDDAGKLYGKDLSYKSYGLLPGEAVFASIEVACVTGNQRALRRSQRIREILRGFVLAKRHIRASKAGDPRTLTFSYVGGALRDSPSGKALR